MRILLINPPGWQKESINLGLSYIAASLEEAGFAVLIIDLNADLISDAALVQKATDYSPSVIGCSVKTATANECGRIVTLLSSEFKEATLICGGPHVTLCVESFMRDFPCFHFGILGEGEQHVVALVRAVENHQSAAALPGVAYRVGDGIVVNHWFPPADLDALPLPDLDAIEGFDWDGFRYPIVTSRGCPFNCIYCCVNKLTGSRKWRARGVANVVDELEFRVRTRGLKSFEIWDDNFTLDIQRAKAICSEIIRRKLNLSWYCHNGIRADRLDLELAILMQKAGCTSIALGIESGNPETFDSIKKGEPLSAVVTAVQMIKKAGMDAIGYFIIGLPGDTLERFIQTVRFQRTLKLHHHVFGMLIPYPKTEVWDIVQAQGRMLTSITDTQHFTDDLVPICYEMPDFPRQDMIRAYSIARYFPLYEATEQIIRSGMTPVVVSRADKRLNALIAGMVIACHPRTRHIILTAADESTVQHPSFSQIPAGASVTFQQSDPELSPHEGRIVIWQRGVTKNLGDLFHNAAIFLVSPSPFALHEIRKFIPPPGGLPRAVRLVFVTLGGLASIFPSIGFAFVRREIIGYLRALVDKPLSVIRFLSTKRKLRKMRIAPQKDFPHHEDTAYL